MTFQVWFLGELGVDGEGGRGGEAMSSPFDAPDTRRRVTLLEDYWPTGDFECFCFDKRESPEGDDRDWREQNVQRVYPQSMLPAGTYGRKGDWRITVEFIPTTPTLSAPEV